jgi:hypothetical protein
MGSSEFGARMAVSKLPIRRVYVVCCPIARYVYKYFLVALPPYPYNTQSLLSSLKEFERDFYVVCSCFQSCAYGLCESHFFVNRLRNKDDHPYAYVLLLVHSPNEIHAYAYPKLSTHSVHVVPA